MNISIGGKHRYVESVEMLKMDNFAHAFLGVRGQGLNVEQRKLHIFSVELAARPRLLLFLDEPTSGSIPKVRGLSVRFFVE
jgi:ATP-binding cassette subfamily G (WHITE) protein 2 (PDR)